MLAGGREREWDWQVEGMRVCVLMICGPIPVHAFIRTRALWKQIFCVNMNTVVVLLTVNVKLGLNAEYGEGTHLGKRV